MTTPTTRIEQIAPATLPLYRAVIDHVVQTGEPPSDALLAARIGLPLSQIAALRAELVEKDWLGLDAAGEVVALYPFSPAPTGITVSLAGATRHAMCALDALGVAPMLERAVTIASTCVHCDTPIAATVTPTQLVRWSPAELVITARCGSGSAHTTRCHAMRFACSGEHARAWIALHGAPDDLVLGIEPAFATARKRFATCYSEGRCERPLSGGEVDPHA